MVEVVGLETADTLAGTDAADTLTGNGGDDRLDGLAGSDSLFGGAGNDTADGGAGDDSISGGSGNDSLDGDRDTTVTSSDVTTTTTNDPLTISLTVADESNRVFEDISGFVSREAQVSADLNIAYVIDVSGSMGGQFQGSTVGNLNGDGSANTLLDAVIASFSSLNQSLIDAGLGDANIAIIPFASNAQIVFTGRADQDSDQNGVLDVVQVLSALDDGGTTAFDDGLQQAQVFFDAAASGANQVFFISDGLPDSNSFTDESEGLRDPAGTNASIRAIGLGNGASLDSLDLLDDGVANSSVERVLDPDALDAGLIDTDVPVSEIDRVEIFVNGVLVTTIDAAQLVETPFGLRFSATVAGLSPAFEDNVAARVVAVDGTTVTTSQVIEVAASNAAGDDTLDGGPGNDTLDGNGGTDTVDYSAGGNLLVSDAELGLQDIGGTAPTLFDGDGFEWDFNSSLSVVDGSNDAFDGGLVLNIVQGGATTPFTPDGELRQSADGRTVAAAGASQDIAIGRQVFVPGDAAFARYLETFTNLGSSTQSFSIRVVSDLGSDAGTRVVVQSPVDQGFNAGDRFVISDDAVGGSGDPFILHYFGDGSGAVRPTVGALANDTLFYQFDLTLAPGESVSILHFTSQSQDLTVMGNLLLALEGGATGQLQSMTAADVARVANFDLDPDALVGNPVTVDLEGGQALDPFGALDVLSSIENVIGSPADDAIAGDGGQNRLEGRDGDDALFGRSEDDVLVGGAGDDLLVGDGQENTTTDATVTTIAGDPLTISLTLPDASNDTVVPVSGFVSGEAAVGEAINIAFVIDVSGSMLSGFSGASVGDQDGDGTANTLLDAVIASFVSLNRSLVDAGLQDANVAVIPFSDDATVAEVAAAGFDSDLDGLTDIEEALRALTPGNLTFFDAGLASAIDFFQQAGPGANHVFFISDGVPNGGPFADESAVLRDPAGINATIRGIGLGAGAALDQIDLLDDGLANGSVERVTDPALLDANLQDSGVDAADIARVELLLNGTVVQTIDAGDLTVTPLGLRYAADLGGLDPNAADAVTARVVASDGSTASTSQTVGVLVGDGTGDDTLLGDAGADTLTGNGGDDQLVGGDGADIADGGAGNDEIFGGSDGDLLLGGEGADRIDGDGNLAVTSSDTVTTITTNEPLTISMTVADRSDAATETLTGFVSRDQVVNDDLNIAFVLDRSGSMINSFQGAAVGDVNGDGSANTILDAVIVAVGSLTDSLVDAGLGGASISVIQFDSTAEIIGAGRADADIDGDGVADVNAVLSGIQAGGTTHFDAALAEAINFFGTVGGGANHVFFLSDGLPNGGPFLDESEILRDPAGINATIRAISLGSGNNLLDLDLLDDGLDNGSVELAADPAALDANLQGADVEVGDIDRVEIRVNGVLQTTIPAAALISTPFGLRFSAQVTGLDIAADDVVQATLIASDGTSVSTSQTIEVDGGAGAGADLIGGGAGNDTLSGNGGNDTIQGNADDDVLFGGAGDDSLQGNDGNDTLTGGLGDDTLDGGVGIDMADFSEAAQAMTADLVAGNAVTRAPDSTGEGQENLTAIENLTGSGFDDLLRGDVGDNLFLGGDGADSLIGGDGADTLHGEAGDDRADGEAGDDRLFGDGGDDTLSGGAGDDLLDGGAGIDLADFAGSAVAVNVDLVTGTSTGQGDDTLVGIEHVVGSVHDDLLRGNTVANLLQGLSGDDTLSGGTGDDTLDGGQGTDTADFSGSAIGVSASLSAGTASGQGNDSLTGLQNLIGSAQADILVGDVGSNLLEGGGGQDVLTGFGGNDTLVGGDGDDVLSAGTGDDRQFGGNGGDVFAGSQGNDLVDGGGGTDILDHALSGGAVQVDLGQGLSFGQGNDTLVSIEQVVGSGFDDSLRGSDGDEFLIGGAGDDTIAGGGGNDSLLGGTGSDRALFDHALNPFTVRFLANGNGLQVSLFEDDDVPPLAEQELTELDASFEIIQFSDITFDLAQGTGGADGLGGTAANDLIGGLGGSDTIDGGSGDDLLIGDGGDDSLLGQAGDDTLLGGDGDDTLSDGGGTDLLVGGAGSDLFIIGAEDGTTTISGLESGSDLIDLRAFDIFDFDGLLAVSEFPVVAAVDGAPDSIMEVTLGPTRTLVIETFVGPDPQAGDFIFADAPPPDDSNVIIAPSIPGAIAGTGDSFSFSTIYTNGLGDETTTGVGLRIHFDSSVLTYDQASNVFARSLQPFGQVIEADSQDFDSDPTTDTFVAFNWADLGGNWPGPGNLPQVLLDSTFTVTGNSADTVINYSASSLPNGFGFEATSFQVVADRWPLPDDLSVTEGAANGVVVADLADGLVLDPNDPGSFTLLDDAGGRFRLDGFVLEVADGGLIDFETDASHDISIRIDSNTGASVARSLTVAVEDAAFQIVTPVVPGVIAGAGDTVVVSAEYTTADPVDATLSGLGLRVHFDSTALSFVGFENLFQTALQPFGQVVEQDTADFDNDATTDSFIATSWADFNQNFPGAETQLLYDLLFTSIGGSDATVNFSVSSVAAGRTFVSESFAVVGDRWPLPDNLAVAENSGDGTLVADLADGLVLDANDPGSFTLLDDAGGRFALNGFELLVANGGGLDFESTASHDITLRIASNTGAVAERTLTIGVSDVNEAPTAVELDNAEVSEAATTGTLVGRLSGEDPEGDAVLFALLDNAGGRFALDGDRIVVAGNGVLDFETAQSHQIRVEARDSAGLTFEDVLTIDVTDVAEATMDLDGDGIQNALSDGLIALGRMFGAPVQQLSGFAASGSPGADTAQLEQRLLEAEAGFFDVDGDGVQNALSDGLIILGRLFGAPASQLASFANPVGSRTSAEEIGSFLDVVDINLALVSAAGTDAVL